MAVDGYPVGYPWIARTTSSKHHGFGTIDGEFESKRNQRHTASLVGSASRRKAVYTYLEDVSMELVASHHTSLALTALVRLAFLERDRSWMYSPP
jgi:hypothetical protein